MTAEKRFINFRLDGSHVTSRARRCDVTKFLKLSLSNSYHIVLTCFGVRYDTRFVIHVLYKKFTKLLTDTRMLFADVCHLQVYDNFEADRFCSFLKQSDT